MYLKQEKKTKTKKTKKMKRKRSIQKVFLLKYELWSRDSGVRLFIISNHLRFSLFKATYWSGRRTGKKKKQNQVGRWIRSRHASWIRNNHTHKNADRMYWFRENLEYKWWCLTSPCASKAASIHRPIDWSSLRFCSDIINWNINFSTIYLKLMKRMAKYWNSFYQNWIIWDKLHFF